MSDSNVVLNTSEVRKLSSASERSLETARHLGSCRDAKSSFVLFGSLPFDSPQGRFVMRLTAPGAEKFLRVRRRFFRTRARPSSSSIRLLAMNPPSLSFSPSPSIPRSFQGLARSLVSTNMQFFEGR